jgi:hypothetical protein
MNEAFSTTLNVAFGTLNVAFGTLNVAFGTLNVALAYHLAGGADAAT